MIRSLAYIENNWEQTLTLVELAVNSAMLDSTMLSLAHVMFGQPLRMPVDHLDGLHPVQAA